jgi:hypothetical protein
MAPSIDQTAVDFTKFYRASYSNSGVKKRSFSHPLSREASYYDFSAIV